MPKSRRARRWQRLPLPRRWFARRPEATLDRILASLIAPDRHRGAELVELRSRVAAACPSGHDIGRLDPERLAELRALFMPELYAALQGRVEESSPVRSDMAWFAHYLVYGWKKSCRPSVLFHEAWYRTECERLCIEPIGSANPWLHWYFVGRPLGLIPTPLFDVDFYLDSYVDVRTRCPSAPFEHYLSHGKHELGRSPSRYFDPHHYASQCESLTHSIPLLDYVLHARNTELATARDFDCRAFIAADPNTSTPAEEAAMYIRRRVQRLDQSPLVELIADVQTLEPQIVRPYGPCQIQLPPVLHPATDITRRARSLTERLPKRHYQTVILIPHCRMAGSAKVAGSLAAALASLTAADEVLIVTTDLSVFERADWFPASVDVVDFNAFHEAGTIDQRVLALFDLVRGLRPERLINVNSNLGWHLTNQYGRQLASWMAIHVYLFCWDLDSRGNPEGYPIQWFLPTFDHASGVFTDEASLREVLIHRYAPSRRLVDRIVTLYEPARDTHRHYRDALAEAAGHRDRHRVFWCGRFDRQKRLDILVAIARAMSDVEFHVWGKAVIQDDEANPLADAPSNVQLMGEYLSVDDMPIASYDAYLYTSAWDGMPSVLIEMSTRNIPIVASRVGGVGELITDKTGWPIGDIDNVDAYVKALQEVIDQPEVALEKATRLRRHTLALCNEQRYLDTLKSVLAREGENRRKPLPVFDPDTATMPPACPIERPRHDITAVLTAHNEGALASVSYRSFETACQVAEEAGLSVERMIVLDHPDCATRAVFEDIDDTVRLVETEVADQGAARNLAAQKATGRTLAFLDGDDLWSSNWLSAAYRFLERSPEHTVAHPEFCRFFSGTSSVFLHVDQDDPLFESDFLRHANYWDAMGMASRAIHLSHPYCRRQLREGFAFEDWHWNCETLVHGIVHKSVIDTIHFKRRRENSQNMQAGRSHAQMPQTALTRFASLGDSPSIETDRSMRRLAA